MLELYLERFNEHFGMFLWIWKGFGILLIVQGTLFMFMYFFINGKGSKIKIKNRKDIDYKDEEE